MVFRLHLARLWAQAGTKAQIVARCRGMRNGSETSTRLAPRDLVIYSSPSCEKNRQIFLGHQPHGENAFPGADLRQHSRNRRAVKWSDNFEEISSPRLSFSVTPPPQSRCTYSSLREPRRFSLFLSFPRIFFFCSRVTFRRSWRTN